MLINYEGKGYTEHPKTETITQFKPALCETLNPNELIKYEEDWVAEPKIDGSRAIIYIDFKNKEVKIIGRRGTDYTSSLPEFKVSELAKQFPLAEFVVIDGELFAGDFGKTETRLHTSSKSKISILSKLLPVTFWAFDILVLDDVLLTDEPYYMRRHLLHNRLSEGGLIKLVPQITGNFTDNFRAVTLNNQYEGLVLKHKDGIYSQGNRLWFKVKSKDTIELDIITHDKGDSGNALVLDTNRGRVSVPNSVKQKEFYDKKPKVVEVEYQELTSGGMLRFPKFKRFRYDK